MKPTNYLDRIRRKLKQIEAEVNQPKPDAMELAVQARKLAATAESYAERMKHK